MHRIFEQYLHDLELAADKERLRDAMKAFAGGFGLHSVAYLTIPRTVNHRTRVISTYPPEWIAHYLAYRYQMSDPVVAWARRQPQLLVWGPDLAAGAKSAAIVRFFGEAAAFGIVHGLTVPIHENGIPIAAMTFATDRRGQEYRNCIRRHAPVLQFGAYCLHNHVRTKLNRRHVADAENLSYRQNQCMELIALGKTAPEIAEILHIKTRTAVFHIQEGKKKLNARTTPQARMSFIASRQGIQVPSLPPLSDLTG
ncbi:MAG TPA: LuxR family transcriptional regulator [Rhizomicrobium sp.]